MKSIFKITSILILLLPFSCKKDDVKVLINDEFERYTKLIESNELIVVQTPAGVPIQGAQMILENNSYVSNAQGLIFLDKIPLKNSGHLVFLSHPEFFKTPKRIYPDKGVVHLTMIPLGTAKQFNAQTDSEIEFDGVIYHFPSNCLVDNSGNRYNGEVVIYSKRLNPSDPTFGAAMPSDLRAFDNKGKSVTLSSYGMVATELYSSQGVQLNIAEGARVKISLKLDPSLSQIAPLSIPVWSLSDKDKNGAWKEEGNALKISDNYVFEVEHFSFWNCDVPGNYVFLQGRVLDQNKKPLQNLQVKVSVSNSSVSGYGETNAIGWFGGNVPAGVALKLVISNFDNCVNQVLFEMDLGELLTDKDLGDIILNLQKQEILVSGKVEACNSFNLKSSIVKLSYQNMIEYLSVDQSGEFASVISCLNPGQIVVVQVFDYLNLKESDIVSYSYTGNGLVSMGTITPCNPLDIYFTVSIDGGPEEFLLDSIFNLDTLSRDSIDPNLKLHGIYFYGYSPSGKSISVRFEYEIPSINIPMVTRFMHYYYNNWVINKTININCQLCALITFTEYQYHGGYVNGNYQFKSNNGELVTGRFRLKR